jgi:hypothetical protein
MGRNSLWLASRGWDVTGIDVADEGIRLAQEANSKRPLIFLPLNACAFDRGAGHVCDG